MCCEHQYLLFSPAVFETNKLNRSEQMALKSSCYYANLSFYSPNMCLANHFLKGEQRVAQFNAYKQRYAPPWCMETILCPSLNTIMEHPTWLHCADVLWKFVLIFPVHLIQLCNVNVYHFNMYFLASVIPVLITYSGSSEYWLSRRLIITIICCSYICCLVYSLFCLIFKPSFVNNQYTV